MDVEICQKLLSSPDVTVEKTHVSYLAHLFPQLQNPSVLLLRKWTAPTSPTRSPKSSEQPTELDVTGSPLEHSFGDDDFNVTTSPGRSNWLPSEEHHIGLPLRRVAEFVNRSREELSKRDLPSSPIVALVDPTENDEHCILIGETPEASSFSSLKVRVLGTWPLSAIEENLSVVLREHRHEELNPKPTDDADVECSAVWELSEDVGSFLKVEAAWSDLTFLPPLRESTATLAASVSSPSASPLATLWSQILLLLDYLAMLEAYRAENLSSRYSVMPLNFPKNFAHPFITSSAALHSRLARLLSGEEIEEVEVDEPTETSTDDDSEMKLIDLVKVLDSRQNQDFTDALWSVAKGSESYRTMTDVVHAVFEEIVLRGFRPQLNAGEETRFAKLVGELDPAKGNLPQLAGSVSMELVIDAGIEKLSRDYAFLLSTGNLMEVYDVKVMLKSVSKGELDVSACREKLLTLAQIHMSLEFLNLIQSQLNCRVDVFHAIFEATLKTYRGPNSPLNLENITNPQVYHLNIVAPKDVVSEVIKMTPTSWMCTLTTNSCHVSFTSITHYSRAAIFPPSIYPPPEDIDGPEEATYHGTRAYIIHYKLS